MGALPGMSSDTVRVRPGEMSVIAWRSVGHKNEAPSTERAYSHSHFVFAGALAPLIASRNHRSDPVGVDRREGTASLIGIGRRVE